MQFSMGVVDAQRGKPLEELCQARKGRRDHLDRSGNHGKGMCISCRLPVVGSSIRETPSASNGDF
jgi:hypothetical protein